MYVCNSEYFCLQHWPVAFQIEAFVFLWPEQSMYTYMWLCRGLNFNTFLLKLITASNINFPLVIKLIKKLFYIHDSYIISLQHDTKKCLLSSLLSNIKNFFGFYIDTLISWDFCLFVFAPCKAYILYSATPSNFVKTWIKCPILNQIFNQCWRFKYPL